MDPAEREVVRCRLCKLNQFKLNSGKCRRCNCVLVLPVVTLAERVIRKHIFPLQYGDAVRRVTSNLRIIFYMYGLGMNGAASLIGVKRNYVYRVEKGYYKLRLDFLFKVADALGITVHDILTLNMCIVKNDEFMREVAGLIHRVDPAQFVNILRCMDDLRQLEGPRKRNTLAVLRFRVLEKTKANEQANFSQTLPVQMRARRVSAAGRT